MSFSISALIKNTIHVYQYASHTKTHVLQGKLPDFLEVKVICGIELASPNFQSMKALESPPLNFNTHSMLNIELTQSQEKEITPCQHWGGNSLQQPTRPENHYGLRNCGHRLHTGTGIRAHGQPRDVTGSV